MLWPSDPLILSGPTAKGRAWPGDRRAGAGGRRPRPRQRAAADRLRRVHRPGAAAAVLVEAGQHWEAATVACAQACLDGPAALHRAAGPAPGAAPVRVAEVTVAVTAATSAFAFVRPFRGGQVIAARNTLIALDGTAEIRTPHDDCMLVMPSLRPSRGHTAVRLARFVDRLSARAAAPHMVRCSRGEAPMPLSQPVAAAREGPHPPHRAAGLRPRGRPVRRRGDADRHQDLRLLHRDPALDRAGRAAARHGHAHDGGRGA